MTTRQSRLRRTGRYAAVLGALYTTALLWIARPEGSSATWDAAGPAWLDPTLLLAAQVLCVSGLMALVFSLRGLARALARQETDGGPPLFLGSEALTIRSVTLLPLAIAGAATTGILGAARGMMTPTTLLLWTAGVPAVAYAASLRPPPARASERPTTPAEVQQRVSRLRGASLMTAAIGGLLFFVSGSLVFTALLPYAMLREVPRGGPIDLGGGVAWHAPEERDRWVDVPATAAPTTPAGAGTAIHTLFFVGSPVGPGPLERPPPRTHGAWWVGEAPHPLGLPPHAWASELASALAPGGINSDTRAFLAGLANHPANGEFDRVASAHGADLTGARLADLEAQPTAAFELPVPRYVELWNGVRGRIAGAVWIANQGDEAEARRRIASVAWLGWLLHHEGPASLDAVMGMEIAREAGLALASLNAQPGAGTAGAHTPAMGPRRTHVPGRPPPVATIADRARWLAAHQAALEDSTLPRSLRFEAFALAQTFRPCRSVAAILWEPASATDGWSRQFRESLATHASEAPLAALLAHGWLGTRAGIEGWGWLPRILAIALTDRPAVTHCAPLAATRFSRG